MVVTGRGRSVFVKEAGSEETAALLRREMAVARVLPGGVAPRLLGALDGPLPVLVFEDLSGASWQPARWTRRHTEACGAALRRISQVPAPGCVPPFPALTGSWAKVAASPQRFLASDTVSRVWLDRALPLLLDAETRGGGTGRTLMHHDLHSGNVCFERRQAKLVDWGLAHRGNPAYDWGYLTLHASFFGGPRPSLVLRHEPEIAAIIAGRLACRPWSTAGAWSSSGLRLLVRACLLEALRWVSACLELPPPAPG